jgi:hypothetical protein
VSEKKKREAERKQEAGAGGQSDEAGAGGQSDGTSVRKNTMLGLRVTAIM